AMGGELGVDDQFVYWSVTEPPVNGMFPVVSEHLVRWPKGALGLAATQIVDNVSSHFIFGDDYLYSLSSDKDRIFRYDKDGTNVTTVVEQLDPWGAIVAAAPRAHRLGWARVELCDVVSTGVCSGAIYEVDES